MAEKCRYDRYKRTYDESGNSYGCFDDAPFVFAGKIVSSSSVLGFPTLLIAHVTFNLPYVILSVLPKLRQTDRHLSEAAQDLGCTPTSAFSRLCFPISSPV